MQTFKLYIHLHDLFQGKVEFVLLIMNAVAGLTLAGIYNQQ